jgi:TolA-binding protein
MAGILVGLFIILSVLGRKGEYVAEKAMYRINKKFAKIQKDPLATPEAEFNEVIEGYKAFLENFPQSRLAPFAHILIGRTFILKKDFEMARSTFERITQQYADKPALAAQAVLEIATTYSSENNNEGLVKSFERLKRDYPLTEQGLKAPFTLAQLESTRPGVTPQQAFEKAIHYYRGLIVEHPHSEVSFKALFYIGSVHLYMKNWQPAVNVYSEILLTYTEEPFLTPTTLSILLKTINTVCVVQLNDFDHPIKVYSQFVTKYPDNPATPVIDRMIQGLKDLKAKNIEEQAKQAAPAPMPQQQPEPQAATNQP